MHAAHDDACVSLLLREPKFDPKPAAHVTWSAHAELSSPMLYFLSAARHCSHELEADTKP